MCLKVTITNLLSRIKPKSTISVLNGIGFVIAVIYFTSMFLVPFINHYPDWEHIQKIWDRWQSLNVGMLAFLSSIIALNISRYIAYEQRKREFSAAKAFLPDSLSELCDYLQSCALILDRAWGASSGEYYHPEIPSLPNNYREIFRECIKHAKPDVGNYLSNILVKLQIHHARLSSLFEEGRLLNRVNVLDYMVGAGEIQVLINKLFDFARSMEDYDATTPVWDDFHNAYVGWFADYDHINLGENRNLRTHTIKYINTRYN